MKDDNVLYWLWLSEKCGIATKDFRSICEKFENPFDIYRMTTEEIEYLEGASASLKARLSDKSLEEAYSTLKYCKNNKVKIISYRDERYPEALKEIENPPVLLYVLGDIPQFDTRLCIGIVGTRKMSDYGKSEAYKLAFELAAAGVVIISGMALGIDAVSAVGAIEGGGTAVAVLGCGIARIYPKEHAKLQKAILRGGAVISEYPPFEAPNRQNFPKRNRIISGLCRGVIVIEGPEGSGALITAAKAIAQGRELFALPGNIDEQNAQGPNGLIREGANVVLCSEDIINHYDFLYHGVINYREYAKAKKDFSYSDKILKKYGIGRQYFQEKEARESERGVFYELGFDEPAQVSAAEGDASKAEIEPKNSMPENIVSPELIASLDGNSRAVFEKMPIDTAATPDFIALESGIGIGDVITALTMLEINGLVSSLPGGQYIRK